ncbi:MAG: hypothetical protein M5U05_02055 [Anaerolineales bacterium]|nr:hypothetical protein [Anaerolineales bacterium]
MEWKEIANQPWIWISGALLAVVALYQCTYFMMKALRIMRAHGMDQKQIMGVFRGQPSPRLARFCPKSS